MQYDVTTPAEYFARLDDDWRRETLQQLRALVMQKGPRLTEGINYKMLSYGDERGHVFHLNAQKHYVSLYVGNIEKIDPGGQLLAGIDLGKGCIRFKKSTVVSATQVDKFIERALQRWSRGEDTGC